MQPVFTTAAVVALTGSVLATPITESGAPAWQTPVIAPAANPAPVGVDDTGVPMVDIDADAVNYVEVEPEAATSLGGEQSFGPMPAATTLVIELVSNPSALAIELAVEAERAWADADHRVAEQLIADIDAMGELVADTYAYHAPQASLGRAFSDALVKEVDAQDFALDFDRATGNLFAVLDEGTTWTVHISTDGGSTWAQTFNFGADPAHLDMAVVDGFVYVGYNPASNPTEARLRRFSAADGQVDNGYSFQTIFTTPVLNTVLDLAIESNQDEFNNRIFYAIIQSDNTLRYAFDVASDGTTFTEESGNGIIDATSNLDMHYDVGNLGGGFLHFCYVTTTDQIRHIGRGNGAWSATTFLDSYGSGSVGISAHEDAVMVAFRTTATPAKTRYRVSYDDGVTWNFATLGDNTTTSMFSPDISLSLGYGSAIVSNTEAGPFDPILFEHRDGYAPGSWDGEVTINTVDALSGGDHHIEALPTFSSGADYSYGVLFEGQSAGFTTGVYFTRTEPCAWLGDIDNDGDVELDDLLSVLANFGTFNPVGDTNGDGFVDLTDLLTVLADFGSDCSAI